MKTYDKVAQKKYYNSEKGKSNTKRVNASEKGKARQRKYWISEKGKANKRKASKKYNSIYPEKKLAQDIAKKITSKPCSVKGCNKKGEKHHEDYSKPLDVIFLCYNHHRQLHKACRILRGET